MGTHFGQGYSQNKKSQNLFKRPQQMVKSEVRSEQWKNRIKDWVTFYRRNMHRFIEHYFGIKLHWYQVIWIYFMSISDTFVTIASRASAKSWLIAIFALARAVLYPNSEIVVVAARR